MGSVAFDFGRAVVLGVGFGVLVGIVIAFVRRKVTESAIDTSISFIVPYLAYLPAEHYHGSGVLAVVVAGLLLGHKSPIVQNASSRVSERINWTTIQFILENVVFLMLGMQMRRLVDDAERDRPRVGRVIVALRWPCWRPWSCMRPIWVFPFKWLQAKFTKGEGKFHPKAAAVISWAGMRGVVTLAAAFALPENTPQRSTLVLAAMAVTVATLLLQGLSLPWLARTLGVRGPDPREDALQEATILQSSVAAGLKALEEHDDVDGDIIETLRGARREPHQHRLGAARPGPGRRGRDAERDLPPGAA